MPRRLFGFNFNIALSSAGLIGTAAAAPTPPTPAIVTIASTVPANGDVNS